MKPHSVPVEEVRHNSSLFLQMALWSNVYLFVVWALAYAFFILHSVIYLESSQLIFTGFAFTTAVVTELLRLVIGYSGNLKRKSVDLCVFLVVSIVIQTPVLLYLTLFLDTQIHLLILGCLILLCLLFEVNIGAHTWRKMSSQQAELQRIKLLHAQQHQQDENKL